MPDRDKEKAELLAELAALRAQLREGEERLALKDLSERRLAEELRQANLELEKRVAERSVEVARERRRLLEVLETLPVMICLLTPDHHVAFANRAFREKFGEANGRTCHDFCFGNPQPCEFCQAFRVLETGQPHRWEVTGPDGSLIEAHDFPFTDTDGSPLVLEMDVDITARRRTEEALKQSLSLLKAALHSTADGILVVANDGRISEYNAKFVEMWRLPAAVLELHDDDAALLEAVKQLKDPDRFLAKVRELYATPEATSFDVLELTDGRVFERYSLPQRIDGRVVGRVWSFRDVTERRRAEDDLRVSEAKFRSIFEHIGIGVAVIGREMEIISLNPLMRQWFPDLDLSQRHICYQSFNNPPREKVCDYCPTILTLRDGLVHIAETDTPTPEGMRHYQVISSPLLAADGSVQAAIEMVQDVTERREVELALAASEERFRAITITAADAVVLIDDQGRITYWNPAAERIFGYSAEEANNRELHQLVAPVRFHEAFRLGFAHFVATGEGPVLGKTIELAAMRKDGSEFPLEITISAMDLNGRRHALGVIRDITERKSVEDTLRKTQFVVDTTADGVYWIGADARIISVNEAVTKSLGYAREELLAMCVHDISPDFPPEVWDKHWEEVRQRKSFTFETRGKTKAGRLFPVEVMINYVQFEGQEYNCAFVRDISARKQGEERIRELALELRMILDTLTVGVALIKGRRVQWANAALDRIFGFAPGGTAGLETAGFYADEDGYRRVGSEGYARLATGEAYSTEIELKHGDGTKFWCKMTGRAVNPDDLNEGSIWTLDDITERRSVEAALQASELKYRELVEAANSVILRWSTDGVITYINGFGARFFGYDPDELVGRNVLGTIVPPLESSGRDLEEMIRRIESDPSSYRANENENITKDGRRLWLRWENRAITGPGGALGGILSIGYDITEQKAADQALRESEERFRTLFENAAIAVFIHAEDGRVLEANRKALADNGLDSLEELQTRDFWLPEPYSLADAMGWLRKAAVEGPQRFEWQDLDRHGRRYWRDMTLKKTILNGQPRLIAIAVDITERKLAEAQLRHQTVELENLAKTLEQRVEAELALRLKNEQILVQQSKLAALGETLGAIAHQWRQPLNSLGLIIQNLRDAQRFGELNAERVEQTVEKSMSQISHMSKTIDDFRNFFQPDKEKTVFDTMSAASEVLTLFSAQLQAHGICFRLHCHPCNLLYENLTTPVPCSEALVLGYRNEFEHVLLNLVNNARDAILMRREHSGWPAQGVLDLDFYNRDGKVVITVSDNGGGIEARQLPRVFDPYFTTKEPTKGTGLGLYMSKVIIEEHMGGTITVANGERGAVFTIELTRVETGEQCDCA